MNLNTVPTKETNVCQSSLALARQGYELMDKNEIFWSVKLWI